MQDNTNNRSISSGGESGWQPRWFTAYLYLIIALIMLVWIACFFVHSFFASGGDTAKILCIIAIGLAITSAVLWIGFATKTLQLAKGVGKLIWGAFILSVLTSVGTAIGVAVGNPNATQEVSMIEGSLGPEFPVSENVYSDTPGLYFQRFNRANSKVKFQWVMIPRGDPKKVFPANFYLNHGENMPESQFQLPYPEQCAGKRLDLYYDEAGDQLVLECEGERHVYANKMNIPPEVTRPGEKLAGTIIGMLRPSLVACAYADSFLPTKKQDYYNQQLLVEDAVVRRLAREELAKEGAKALGYMETALLNENVYRLRLGVLVALVKMDPQQAKCISPKFAAAIVAASSDKDETIRVWAQKAMTKTNADYIVNVEKTTIRFNPATGYVDPASASALSDVARKIKTIQISGCNLMVVVEGHTGLAGTEEFNMARGEQEAKAIKQKLVALGIDGRAILIQSYGESRPIDPNDDSKNMRVEFRWQ